MNILADAKANQYLEKYRESLRPQNRGVWTEDIEKIFGIEKVKEKSLEELIEELAKKVEKKIIEIPNGAILDFPAPIDVFGEGERRQKDKDRKGKEREREGKEKQEKEKEGEGGGKEKEEEKKENKGGDGDKEKEDKEREEKPKGDEEKGDKKEKNKSVLNEGDKKDRETNDLDKRWAEKMLEILISTKTIGKDPGYLQRLIEELLKPMIDWRRILRTALTKGIGRNVRRTWARPSRKISDLYPGKEMLKMNKVIVMIDTSGSIGENELKRFVSEVYGILRETSKVVVIPWDATVYDPIELRGMSDIQKLKTSIKGGGGTMIYPALKLVDEKFSSYDMFIIFSDWYIGDINTDEVQNILRKYAKKIIAFTTSARPPEFLESHKIQIVE
jgi:hypothetical protein